MASFDGPRHQLARQQGHRVAKIRRWAIDLPDVMTGRPRRMSVER
jgi:hypothetical protein